jgi:hypothetical protein
VEVDFAETLLRDIASRIQAHADGVIDLDFPAQQQLRLALAHVVRGARDAIRDILASSGAATSSRAQRLHRDIPRSAPTPCSTSISSPRASVARSSRRACRSVGGGLMDR